MSVLFPVWTREGGLGMICSKGSKAGIEPGIYASFFCQYGRTNIQGKPPRQHGSFSVSLDILNVIFIIE